MRAFAFLPAAAAVALLSLATIPAAAAPNLSELQGQPMKAALNPLTPCANPPWIAKFPQHYKIDSCDNKLWDQMSFDLPKGTKVLEGPRTITTYHFDDDKNGWLEPGQSGRSSSPIPRTSTR